MCDEDNRGVPTLGRRGEERGDVAFRRTAFPFVERGTVYGFPLQEDLVEPQVPPGEGAVGALAAAGGGMAYALTTGARGHLVYFHPAFGVVHVGTLGEGAVTGGALVRVGETIFGGWYGEGGGGLFRHGTRAESGAGIEQLRGNVEEVEELAVPGEAGEPHPLPPPLAGEGEVGYTGETPVLPGQGGGGIAALAYGERRGEVYGLTRPGEGLVAVSVGTGEGRVVGKVEGAAAVLGVLPWGHVIGAGPEGQLWEYEPGAGRLQWLEAWAPCQQGKRYAADVRSLLVTEEGTVYGGTGTDGFLFRYEPALGELVNLGKPNRQSCIRALAEGHDGLICGVVEEPGAVAHLFTYDPEAGEFADLGVVASAFTEYWIAHSIGAMCVGEFGEVFLGESDRIGHVMVYYPPVRGRRNGR